MHKYKYFNNVKRDAAFSENPCQFCGSTQDCLEGVFFGRLDIESVCLECFAEKRAYVEIPAYVQRRVKVNSSRKINDLMFTPPIPWVQHNDWPVCCDDFMQYIGEWEQEEFDGFSNDKKGIVLLEELLAEVTRSRVDDITVLWDDLGYDTVAYVFKCPQCGKMLVVCQSY